MNKGGYEMLHTTKLEKDDLFIWLCRIGDQFQLAFLITDPTYHKILYANDGFFKLTGYSIEDLKNEEFNTALLFGENNIEIEELIHNKREELCRKKDGNFIWIDLLCQPILDGVQHVYNLIVFSDITGQKCARLAVEQEKLQQLAFTDPLSGLKNYHYFLEVFQEKMQQHTTGFVLLVQPSDDIQIADTFGKSQLAKLQREIAQRIRKELDEIETIISRAETSLILFAICEEEKIENYITQLLEIAKCPFKINEFDIYISFSIGAVSLRYYHGDVDDLVRFADIALSKAKKSPGNSIVIYKEEFGVEISNRMKIQTALVRAIKNKEITVYLQPKINIETGEVVGFEALARWYSKTLGYVSPAIFIEIAESLGKIQDLDYVILEQVLKWLKNRKDQNLTLLQVAVNISPSHFYLPTFVNDLIYIVKKYGIESKYIKLEITENVGLVDLEKAKAILDQLSQHGFESSVDDFGIGFSSLSYLNQLPISEIKIDRSFINRLHENKGCTIVQAIIQLAKNMGINTVAEGVETEEQLRMIREMACPTAQGFYFYKPLSIEQVDELLK